MTLLLNVLATLFFLSMLAFGIGVCVMMVRSHGRQMLAAFAGRPRLSDAGSGAEIYRIEPRALALNRPQFGWRDDDALPLAA